jgi:hypothetical protein
MNKEGTYGLNKLHFNSGVQRRPAAGVYMSYRAVQEHTISGSVNLIEDIQLCLYSC